MLRKQLTTMVTLKANVRTEIGKKVKKIRKEEKIPAVLYGRKVKSTPVSVGYKMFAKTYNEAGENTIINLEVESESRDVPKENVVLIRDATRDPLTRLFTHADFYQVSMDEKIDVSVPVVFLNEPPIVKDGTAVLARNVYELEVSALPKDLPHEISIDLSRLQAIGDVVMVQDIVVSQGVEIALDEDFVVAALLAPEQEEAETEKTAEEAPAVQDIKTEGEVKREEKAAKKAEEAEA